jgi:DNA-binding beta-propeller fold protein YncE
MFWRNGRRWWSLGIAGLVAGLAQVGCATPAGPLFDPVHPPLVWPPAPETPRIRWVGELSGSESLNAGRSAGEAFKAVLRGPRLPIGFSSPHSVSMSGKNVLAVADVGAAGVHIVDLDRRTHHFVTGWADQRFETPIGACWVGNRLFVTDAARHQVVELDAGGGCHHAFGADELVRPVGIAYVASRQRLYVVDGGGHRIAVYDSGGRLEGYLGGPGEAAGEFAYPTHICWDGADRLAVSDAANFRVQLLDLDGHCQAVIGGQGDGAGDLALPKGVAFDSDGHVYVVDARFENVQIFDAKGRLLLAFGVEGGGRGEFSLPAGLMIDNHDRIWIADSANRRVQAFDYLRVTG